MANGRYLVFVDTINSVSDHSKNIRGEKPLAVVENISGGLSLEKQKELRKRFELKANQIIRLDHIYGLEHILIETGKAFCGKKTKKRGRLKPSLFQEFKGFVNCSDCLKKKKEVVANHLAKLEE